MGPRFGRPDRAVRGRIESGSAPSRVDPSLLATPVAALPQQPRRPPPCCLVSFVDSGYALGGVPTQSVGTLLAAFMVVGTASAAIPVPLGLGVTGVGLTAVLTGAGMPTASAISSLLLSG